MLKINKQNLKLEKGLDKKVAAITDKIDKIQDYFTQKLEFVKMEIESDLSTKTTKMLEQ